MLTYAVRTRRALSIAVSTAATAIMLSVVVALMSLGSVASADPYPPSAPSATSSYLPAVTHARVPADGSAHSLAYTGFATITAIIAAAVLLGGGILLVTLGRRRNTSPKHSSR